MRQQLVLLAVQQAGGTDPGCKGYMPGAAAGPACAGRRPPLCRRGRPGSLWALHQQCLRACPALGCVQRQARRARLHPNCRSMGRKCLRHCTPWPSDNFHALQCCDAPSALQALFSGVILGFHNPGQEKQADLRARLQQRGRPAGRPGPPGALTWRRPAGAPLPAWRPPPPAPPRWRAAGGPRRLKRQHPPAPASRPHALPPLLHLHTSAKLRKSCTLLHVQARCSCSLVGDLWLQGRCSSAPASARCARALCRAACDCCMPVSAACSGCSACDSAAASTSPALWPCCDVATCMTPPKTTQIWTMPLTTGSLLAVHQWHSFTCAAAFQQYSCPLNRVISWACGCKVACMPGCAARPAAL